jgi:signal transduction histidine kinase
MTPDRTGLKRAPNKDAASAMNFLFHDRALAQAAIDSLADLADLPLTLLAKPDLSAVFDHLRLNSFFFATTFPTIDLFREFVSDANTAPKQLVERISRNLPSWGPVFDYLNSQFYLTRGARAEPFIKLLQDHWSWRWVNLLSLYDVLLADPLGRKPRKLFHNLFRPSLLLTRIEQLTSGQYISFGPVKNMDIPAQDTAKSIRDSIQRFHRDLPHQIASVHPIERYEQFLYDRPPIYNTDLEYLSELIKQSLDLISSVRWPLGHKLDYYDVTSITEFTYFIADMPYEASLPSKASLKFLHKTPLAIHCDYPLYLRSQSNVVRRVTYTNELRRNRETGHLSFKLIKRGARRPHAKQISTSISDERFRRGFERYLNQQFEETARRRRIIHLQRLTEELSFLRYSLADNFGMLAADHAPQITSTELETSLGRLISRVAVRACNADHAVIYRYDHLRGALCSVGAYSDNYPQSHNPPADYHWMELIGSIEQKRKRSIAYNAADRNASVVYNAAHDFAPLTNSIQTKVQPKKTLEFLPNGKTILAVPINVFGRLWGVLEIISGRQNAFSFLHLEWAQKLADLIGPYYHEQLLINSLYQIASPKEADTGNPRDRFDYLARQAASIFLCNTAVLWVRDVVEAHKFIGAGFTGRKVLAERRAQGRAPPAVTLTDPTSVIGGALRAKRIWLHGDFGRPPFDHTWLRRQHTRQLLLEGYRYMAVIPIYNLEQNPIAAVSVYSRERPFLYNWANWAKYISSYLGVMISRVHNIREVELQQRRLVAHEISTAARLAKDSAKSLTSFIEKIPAEETPANIANWTSDITTHLEDIETSISDWASDRRLKERPEAMLITKAHERLKFAPPPDINFTAVFHACIGPLRRPMRAKGMWYTVHFPPEGPELRMYPEDLRMILNNLLGNAVKYGADHTNIQGTFRWQAFGLTFSLRNKGPRLDDGEDLRLFDLGFRGRNARKTVEGSGIGLFLLKKLADLYEISVSYEQEASPPETSLVTHRFDLDFPVKLVANDVRSKRSHTGRSDKLPTGK